MGQEATVRTLYGTTDWFKIRKGIRQGCIQSPYLFNLYAEYIIRNAGWMNHKLESRLPGEISTTSDTSEYTRTLLERKAMANLDSILRSKDVIFPTKVHTV